MHMECGRHVYRIQSGSYLALSTIPEEAPLYLVFCPVVLYPLGLGMGAADCYHHRSYAAYEA